jgi:ferric-dicitrate binding protein FerR (iron transport regulator)
MKYLISLLVLPLLLASPVFSQGQILKVIGSVNVSGKAVKSGDYFKLSQTLTTGPKSLALVRFTSGSTLKVNENSSLKLERVLKKKKQNIRIFRLLKGSSFFKKDPKKEEKLQVRAKNVSMGVRGTEFFVSFGKESIEDVYMCVRSGKVLIKGANQKKVTLVKAGEGVVVPKGLVSSKPKPLPWTKDLNWNLDPSAKELENKASIEESYQDPIERDYD